MLLCGSNAVSFQCCGSISMVWYTHLNLALLLHKTVLKNFPIATLYFSIHLLISIIVTLIVIFQLFYPVYFNTFKWFLLPHLAFLFWIHIASFLTLEISCKVCIVTHWSQNSKFTWCVSTRQNLIFQLFISVNNTPVLKIN